MKPFVDRLQVENFFCVKGVDIELTRVHAFIGPNDSGKSTLLRAVWNLAHQMSTHFPGPPVRWGDGQATVTAWTGEDWVQYSHAHGVRALGEHGLRNGVQLVRLEPDAMREPCSLIPKTHPVAFFNQRGHGLAAVLDVMLSRDPQLFVDLRGRFARLFDGIEKVTVENEGTDRKVLGATLLGGKQIAPAEMSEGMLYWLAFEALRYATKPSVLLIEEPENGLHPARIREVMALLRETSAETQVLIATHSPLVVNELKPEEVTIITRTAEAGTLAKPMTETKNFEQRRQVYALGELWLSYADGVLESELVGPDDVKDAKATG